MNRSGFQKAELALRLKPIVQEKAKEKQAEFYGNQYKSGLRQKSDEVQTRTDEELAKLAGVSRDTIRKVELIKNEGTEEQIQRAGIKKTRRGWRATSHGSSFRLWLH